MLEAFLKERPAPLRSGRSSVGRLLDHCSGVIMVSGSGFRAFVKRAMNRPAYRPLRLPHRMTELACGAGRTNLQLREP
jgi:hypothetical protein